MPVIVVGADTPSGGRIMDALLPREGEVRAFVTDPSSAADLKQRGVKVAIGDISDGTHVGGAALNTFCAIAVVEAATDDRERGFAPEPAGVLAQWADGLRDAGVQRVIIVQHQAVDYASLETAVPEVGVVNANDPDLASEIVRLESAQDLRSA